MQNESSKSGMSKKAAIASIAIGAIAASEDWRAQTIIAVVATIAVVVQGLLDWNRGTSEKPKEEEKKA